MPWLFFVFGWASLVGQILLLREVLVVFHGTEIAIGLFFGAWLSCIGFGAAVGSWMVRRSSLDFEAIFLHSLAVLGISLILEIVFVRSVPRVFGVSPAELAPLSGIAIAAPAATFLTAGLTGFLFPLGCANVPNGGDRSIARLYVFEALGSLVGGLVFTLFLVKVMSPLKVAATVAICVSLSGLIYGARIRRTGAVFSCALTLAVAAALITPVGDGLIQWTIHKRWQALHPGLRLLDYTFTPYQQVEIAGLGKQVSMVGNGKIVSSFPDPHSSDRLAALAMAERPRAKTALLIGGATGSLVGSLLKYPLERVDLVEPDMEAFKAAKRFKPKSELDDLADPRVRQLFMDGRFYVNRLSRARYDLVFVLAPDPVSAFWNRYYTLEFYRALRRGLNPTGIVITGVTSAENFWGAEVASYAGSVFYTLKRVFPSVVATPGDRTLFLACPTDGTLTLDPGELEKRYAELGSKVFDPAAFRTLYPPDRTAFVEKELNKAPKVTNTDLFPISSSLAMVMWARFSGGRAFAMVTSLRRAGIKPYVLALTALFLAGILFRARWGPGKGTASEFRSMWAMAAVGATAMGVQIALMYCYQSYFGHVFERVGLFAGLFMAGLACGGIAARRALSKAPAGDKEIAFPLLALGAMCVGLHWALKWLTAASPSTVEPVLFGCALVSGLITGYAFPLIASRSLCLSGNAGYSGGLTDAADHFGAALGAMITGALMAPLLGVGAACLILGLVTLTPATLILSEYLFRPIDPWLENHRGRTGVSFPFVKTTWALTFLLCAAMAWSLTIGPPLESYTVRFDPARLEALSGSSRFEFHEDPAPHYVGSPAESGAFTVSLSTIPVAGEVKGFGGPINLLVSVSDHGRILGVRIVESKETPSYLKGASEWLKRFNGRSLLKPDELAVDGISGATITCDAIKRILAKTGREIGGPILGIEAEQAQNGSRWKALSDLKLWAVIGLFILFVAAYYSKSKTMRTACLALSFMTLGVWLNGLFTTLEVASLFNGEAPGSGALWRHALVLGAIGISLLWGQAFCGYMCPFGALQEFLAFPRTRRRASKGVETAARYVKFVVMAVVLSLFLFTRNIEWLSFSPLQSFFRFDMSRWVLALSVTALAASLFYFRFWCRYLCPAGAVLALFNKVRLLRRWSPVPKPSRCDLGVRFPDDVDCIRCNRCLFKGGEEGAGAP